MVTTTSTPVEQQTTPENRVILKGVSWSTFKALLADVGDDRAWRIAYDGGVLEIRMPHLEHEVPKGLIESFIEATADELEIEVMKAGSLTLEREDLTRAVEPDTCFYIQNEASVRGKRDINLPEDLPPDLAIESDYTNSSVNKDSIYAAIGVPELWRYRRESLQVYQLVEGKYEKCDRSLAFPFLPVAEIPGFIEQSRTVGQRAAVRLFRQRIIKETLVSRN
ncbi:Uma2 family endonuclease [Microcoleus sp. herbarium2]|uniref:Uma2 family endonuclease n=1 Tax=Microcoleus sp. herbarium2 TaxID=3055433 RepID=UPI002FD14B37